MFSGLLPPQSGRSGAGPAGPTAMAGSHHTSMQKRPSFLRPVHRAACMRAYERTSPDWQKKRFAFEAWSRGPRRLLRVRRVPAQGPHSSVTVTVRSPPEPWAPRGPAGLREIGKVAPPRCRECCPLLAPARRTGRQPTQLGPDIRPAGALIWERCDRLRQQGRPSTLVRF